MDEYETLSHTTWDCKYHIVFIPKYRRKTLYQELRRHLGEVFRRLPTLQIGRRRLIRLADVRHWLAGHEVQTPGGRVTDLSLQLRAEAVRRVCHMGTPLLS